MEEPGVKRYNRTTTDQLVAVAAIIAVFGAFLWVLDACGFFDWIERLGR